MDTAGSWKYRSSTASTECRKLREGRHRIATGSSRCRSAAGPSSSSHPDIPHGGDSHSFHEVPFLCQQKLVRWDTLAEWLLLSLNHTRNSSHSILRVGRDRRSCCCCCGRAVAQRRELSADQRLREADCHVCGQRESLD